MSSAENTTCIYKSCTSVTSVKLQITARRIFFMFLGIDMQASNDLVHRLGGTCQAQLQALDQLRRDMVSSQASHHERHDEQKEALHSMV